MNNKGIQFIAERSGPLAVDNMSDAAAVLAKAIADRRERRMAGKSLPSDSDNVAFGRHLAWLIGFDRLIDDRKEIGSFVERIVEP